ncbi:MAG: LON peptidase substrate-binding domain-containing protein [Pseudomonadota bacterium]
MSIKDKYKSPADLPAKLPIFPLGGALLLPRAHLPLNIFEPRYLKMIDDAMRSHRLIGMVQPDSADGIKTQGNTDARPSVYGVGCAGRITTFSETEDNRFLITLSGVSRFQVAGEIETEEPYRICEVDFAPFADDFKPGLGENDVDRDALLDAFRKFLDANKMEADWEEVSETPTELLVNTLCILSPYDAAEKQAMLEAESLKSRAETLITLTEMVLAGNRAGQKLGATRLQ